MNLIKREITNETNKLKKNDEPEVAEAEVRAEAAQVQLYKTIFIPLTYTYISLLYKNFNKILIADELIQHSADYSERERSLPGG